MSRIIRGVSKNARFFLVDTTDIVQEALNIHKCSPTAIDAFGRLLTAGVIMGSTLKGNDVLTLRTDTDGLLNNMVVTATADGGVKGYLSNPSADVPLRDDGKSNVGALVGRGTMKIIKDMGLNTATADGGVKGYLSNPSADVPLRDDGKSNVGALVGRGTMKIIKDMGLKEPYVGISTVDTGEIAQDLAYYFYNSEQTPTVIALGVKLKDENTVACAGGYMLQLLPDAEDEFITALENKIQAIRPMTELMMGMKIQ